MARTVTIRIPIPQTNPPFMHRSKGLSAFLAPSQPPATSGIGSFFASRAAPVLPAPSIFSRFARRAGGLGSFVAPASYALPGPSLFPQFARRGMGAVARGRRFPRRGMGFTYASEGFGLNPYYYDDILSAQDQLEPMPAGETAPAIAAVYSPEEIARAQAATVYSPEEIARAQSLDAWRQSLEAAQARGVTLTSAQSSALNTAVDTATPAQLTTLAQQVSALSPTGTDAFSKLWASVQTWFAGSTTLFGSSWKNQNLVFGGAAGVLGLALLSSMTGGRKTTRRRNPRTLSVPERHQLKVALNTLKMSDVGARIMGPPSKEEARRIIERLTGRRATE